MNYISSGKFVAVHGLKGILVFRHELGKKSGLQEVNAIFTEEGRKNMIPWFVEKAAVRSGNETYVKLEGINDRGAAGKLLQKEVWLTEPDFNKLADKSAPANLLGYLLLDKKEKLSEILEIIEQPHQLICRIELKGKEVLVPLNDAFLKKIDHKKREVIVDLPDGLIDVYLA